MPHTLLTCSLAECLWPALFCVPFQARLSPLMHHSLTFAAAAAAAALVAIAAVPASQHPHPHSGSEALAGVVAVAVVGMVQEANTH